MPACSHQGHCSLTLTPKAKAIVQRLITAAHSNISNPVPYLTRVALGNGKDTGKLKWGVVVVPGDHADAASQLIDVDGIGFVLRADDLEWLNGKVVDFDDDFKVVDPAV